MHSDSEDAEMKEAKRRERQAGKNAPLFFRCANFGMLGHKNIAAPSRWTNPPLLYDLHVALNMHLFGVDTVGNNMTVLVNVAPDLF